MLIIDNVDDYIEHRVDIKKIVAAASGWKSFSATINGEPLNSRQLYHMLEEIDYMIRVGITTVQL